MSVEGWFLPFSADCLFRTIAEGVFLCPIPPTVSPTHFWMSASLIIDIRYSHV